LKEQSPKQHFLLLTGCVVRSCQRERQSRIADELETVAKTFIELITGLRMEFNAFANGLPEDSEAQFESLSEKLKSSDHAAAEFQAKLLSDCS
jgi:hypothetical protein